MPSFRPVVVSALALALCAAAFVSSSPEVAAQQPLQAVPAPPPADLRPVVGASASDASIATLSRMLRILDADGRDRALLAELRETAGAAATRYEATGVTAIVRSVNGDLRIEQARVVVEPAADGRSCRFELSGAPFGAASRTVASGNVEWGVGPLGGDRVTATLELKGADVEAMRRFLPDRFDPSFSGTADFSAKAEGIVGERSGEEAPATPLKGTFEGNIGWTVLGRTAPLAVDGAFSLDDRSVRIRDGHLRWAPFHGGAPVDLQGWFAPSPLGKFDLTAKVAGIDAASIAAEWNVPEPWRPQATLNLSVNFAGSPGKSQLKYEGVAPALDLPSLGGWPIHAEQAKLFGTLLTTQAEVTVSVKSSGIRVGHLDLGPLPVGITWHRRQMLVNTSNTTLFGGKNTGTVAYRPDEHPAWSMTGAVTGGSPVEMQKVFAPWLGLDLEGNANFTYVFGQRADRSPRWTVHTSLTFGRIGNFDLFGQVFERFAAQDPAIVASELTALVPPPRQGRKGTRAETLFLELERRGPDEFGIGALELLNPGFILHADGSLSKSAGLELDGTVALPKEAVAKLREKAPWFAALCVSEESALVPVTVTGPPSAIQVQLAPAYVELIGRARRGEAVAAPRLREPRHVGEPNMSTIPGHPAFLQE